MQSPWQLRVKQIETSPQDVLFLGGREKLKKQRFVATIPRFSTELLMPIMRLATGRLTTTHDKQKNKDGVNNALLKTESLDNAILLF